jgi:hypothetical protein
VARRSPDGSLYGLLHEWKAVVEKIKAFPELPERNQPVPAGH